MITVCSLRDYTQYKSDFNFLIVRSCKHDIEGMIQLPHLSPSNRLFSYYLNNRDKEGWWEEYSKEFKMELLTEEKQNGIRYICDLHNKGENITLVCYCWSLDNCHRKLVGEYLQELGLDVAIY